MTPPWSKQRESHAADIQRFHEALELSQASLAEAQEGWRWVEQHVHRFVRKAADITNRPTPEQGLGGVQLHFDQGQGRTLVHVVVTEDGQDKDTLRFPLDWLDTPEATWRQELESLHAAGETPEPEEARGDARDRL